MNSNINQLMIVINQNFFYSLGDNLVIPFIYIWAFKSKVYLFRQKDWNISKSTESDYLKEKYKDEKRKRWKFLRHCQRCHLRLTKVILRPLSATRRCPEESEFEGWCSNAKDNVFSFPFLCFSFFWGVLFFFSKVFVLFEKRKKKFGFFF